MNIVYIFDKNVVYW